jgi:hypothetical protein
MMSTGILSFSMTLPLLVQQGHAWTLKRKSGDRIIIHISDLRSAWFRSHNPCNSYLWETLAGFTDRAFAQISKGKYLREVYSILQEEHEFFNIIITLMYVSCILYSSLSRSTNAQHIYINIYINNIFYICTRKSGYNMYRGWIQTDYQNKHYNINQKDEGT